MNPNEADVDSAEELRVTFVPALYIQRRAWVFDILRRERVTQVLDVGCGEGETVECLCNAAPWLPLRSTLPSSSNEPPELDSVSLSQEDELSYKDDFLHVRTLHALDVSLNDLQRVLEVTAPPPPQREPPLWQALPRWESMEAKVWHGGVQVFNPEFVDIECIISTEVIEHLPPNILPVFAPMLLGMYHPRLLLITTPSYSFNDRFTAPDAPPGARQGIPDPTGRTNRIFRHWDHKFEWTTEEFTEWCEEAAKMWGYEVEISGVGVPREKDPFGRDELLGKASQVAAFRRKEGEAMSEIRSRRCAELRIVEQAGAEEPHQLLGNFRHEADPKSRKAGTLEEISDSVLQRMDKCHEGRVTMQELWCERDIALLCGGWLQKLISAVRTTASLSLRKTEKGVSDWVVEREGCVPEPTVCEGALELPRLCEPAVVSGWMDNWGPEVGVDDGAESNLWQTGETWGALDSDGWGKWDTDSVPEPLVGIA